MFFFPFEHHHATWRECAASPARTWSGTVPVPAYPWDFTAVCPVAWERAFGWPVEIGNVNHAPLGIPSHLKLDRHRIHLCSWNLEMRHNNGLLRNAGLILGLTSVLWAAGPDLEQARKLYNLTDFDQSLKVLHAIPDKNGPVYELMGRNYYMQGEYKKASEALEKAVAAEPDNSQYALWLARAHGRRAETSSPFTAPGQASKARQYFEKAAQLNPRNLEALTDLFEYYLEAPGFLGGGLDKAQATAQQIAAVDPGEGHWSLAKLAEKRKQYGSAEEQLRRAIEVSPRQVGRLIDLARFLAKQGRLQEADQSFAKADQIAPNSPKLIYAKADLYIKDKRNLDVAKELLKRYLSLTLSPEDPPRSQAEKLLRQVQGT